MRGEKQKSAGLKLRLEGWSAALWQEVKAALQTLRPDLTGSSSSRAVLFLLSLRGDLSQLLSDLHWVKPQ